MMKRLGNALVLCLCISYTLAAPSFFHPYGSASGDALLHRNDDEYSNQISFPGGFRFFGSNRASLYVNNNGLLSFNGPVSTYTPQGLSAANFPAIAAFWGDVDTRCGSCGFVWYRYTTQANDLNLGSAFIRATQGNQFQATRAFVATWDVVGYYNANPSKLNTFQLVLLGDNNDNSWVIFNYGQLQWTTGDASGGSGGLGGVPATAGFSAGNGVNYADLVGSGTSSVLLLNSRTNVNNPGRFVYQVNEGVVITSCCDTTAIPPSLIGVPASVTVSCDAAFPGVPTVTKHISCPANTPDSAVTPTITRNPGACPQSFTEIRSWSAQDECLRTTTQTQTVTVVDSSAPFISVISGRNLQCGVDSINPSVTGTASASDNCDTSVSVTYADTTSYTGGACNMQRVTRTWTAADDCGNRNTASQTFNYIDTLAPSISAPSSRSLECGLDSTDPSSTGRATATDACNASPLISFSDVTAPNGCLNRITRTWTANDNCGNTASATQTLTLVDTNAPTVTAPASVNVQCGYQSTDPASTGRATASDACSGAITPTFSDATSASSCLSNGVITRTWAATDSCGNRGTASQTITLIDNVAPTLTVPASVNLECGASYAPTNAGTATASDRCDSSLNINFSDRTLPSTCLSVGTVERTWSATDDCQNVATGVQTITITDTTAPVLNAPADVTVECGVDFYYPPATGSATAGDVCDSSVSISFSDSGAASSCLPLGTITRTWTATDDCGNQASSVQTVTIVDSRDPSTSADPVCIFPPNGQYWCYDVANPSFISFDDECSSPTIAYNNDCHDETGATDGCVLQGTQLCLKADTSRRSNRVYTVSYDVTDACGNTATQSAAITVFNTAADADGSECEQATVCITECPDDRCTDTVYPLTLEDGTVVGELHVNNRLGREISFEFKTNEGAIPDRGWWMSGINIQVGSARKEVDWAFGREQSRWFEVIDFGVAFPGGSVECGQGVTFFAAAYVTNDKRNAQRTQSMAYPRSGSATRSIPLPPNVNDYKITYTTCCECSFRTQTQQDYADQCYAISTPSRTSENARIRAISCYRDDFWNWAGDWCLPDGVVIGCSNGFTATFTSPAAIVDYLADEATVGVLSQNLVNPSTRAIGGLGGELAALTLNLAFDNCDAEWSGSCHTLADLKVCRHPTDPQGHRQCTAFFGRSIASIAAEANNVLGGCSQGDATALFECVRYINRAFVDGKTLWEVPDFTYGQCA